MSLPNLVLGAVMEDSQTGYDIHRAFCFEKGMNLWPASHQQIYRECGKLEENNYITASLVPQAGKPDKKVYAITKEGQKQLCNMLLDFPKPQKMRSSHAVSLMFLPKAPRKVRDDFWVKVERSRTELTDRIIELDNQMGTLDELKRRASGAESHDKIVFRLRLIKEKMYLQGEVDWLDRVQLELA